MLIPYYLRELPQGSVDNAESARRFAEKITTLHAEMWRLATERRWHLDLLDHYRQWWRQSPRPRSTVL